MIALLVSILFLAHQPSRAFAEARPGHAHEDLFLEKDLQLGAKAGLQISGFSSSQEGNTILNYQSSIRFAFGMALKFIYELPRIEFDAFINGRGGLNNSKTIYSFSFPLICKFPIELEDDYVDFEAGIGFQPDLFFAGPEPHRNAMFSALASAGLSVDFKDFIMDLEGRYILGLQSIAASLNGAKPRDFQMLVGFLRRF